MSDIYLDNNATTMVDKEVVDVMLPFLTEQFGNPSSMHSFGNKVGRSIKKARKQIQSLLGAEHDSEIIFTSCGTESNSTAILSAIKAQPERKEIITSTVEHPAILNVCEYLEKDGYKVHYLEVHGKGGLDLDRFCFSDAGSETELLDGGFCEVFQRAEFFEHVLRESDGGASSVNKKRSTNWPDWRRGRETPTTVR